MERREVCVEGEAKRGSRGKRKRRIRGRRREKVGGVEEDKRTKMINN